MGQCAEESRLHPPLPTSPHRLAGAGAHCFHRTPLHSHVLHFSTSDHRGSCGYSGMAALSSAVSAATFYYHTLLGSRFHPILADKDIAYTCSEREENVSFGHKSSGNFIWKTNITACPLWGTEHCWSKASMPALLSTQIANSWFSFAALQAGLRHNTTFQAPDMVAKLEFSKLKSLFFFSYSYLLTCSPNTIQTQSTGTKIFEWSPSTSASESGKWQGKE